MASSARRMAAAIRRNRLLAYDDRDEMRVPIGKLREDGNRPGILTVDPDPYHPQRDPIVPFADGYFHRPPRPARHRGDVRIYVGYMGTSGKLGEVAQWPALHLGGAWPDIKTKIIPGPTAFPAPSDLLLEGGIAIPGIVKMPAIDGLALGDGIEPATTVNATSDYIGGFGEGGFGEGGFGEGALVPWISLSLTAGPVLLETPPSLDLPALQLGVNAVAANEPNFDSPELTLGLGLSGVGGGMGGAPETAIEARPIAGMVLTLGHDGVVAFKSILAPPQTLILSLGANDSGIDVAGPQGALLLGTGAAPGLRVTPALDALALGMGPVDSSYIPPTNAPWPPMGLALGQAAAPGITEAASPLGLTLGEVAAPGTTEAASPLGLTLGEVAAPGITEAASPLGLTLGEVAAPGITEAASPLGLTLGEVAAPGITEAASPLALTLDRGPGTVIYGGGFGEGGFGESGFGQYEEGF